MTVDKANKLIFIMYGALCFLAGIMYTCFIIWSLL